MSAGVYPHERDPCAREPWKLEAAMEAKQLEEVVENDVEAAERLELAPAAEGALEVLTEPERITREQRRSRRKRAVRARTISVKRMTKRELEIGRLLYPETDYWKPRAREECAEGPRPCPFVSCKYHLFIDVSPRTGAIKLNFPDLEVWDMTESCALDVADRGGTTLEDVGAIMNLTRERIRQVEVKALAKLEALRDMMALRDYVDEGPVGRRRLPRLSTAEIADINDDDDEETAKKPEPPVDDLDVGEFDLL